MPAHQQAGSLSQQHNAQSIEDFYPFIVVCSDVVCSDKVFVGGQKPGVAYQVAPAPPRTS
jgi:hypothetical protein